MSQKRSTRCGAASTVSACSASSAMGPPARQPRWGPRLIVRCPLLNHRVQATSRILDVEGMSPSASGLTAVFEAEV